VSPIHFKRLSDESLGSRLASGQAAAFDELYRRYVNRLAAYGSHLLGDAASGDDVAQATMLKAYTALREGRVPEKMKPWLFRIAHNTAIDLVVRRRDLPSGDLPETPAADHEPFAGALVEALATLPDRQRRVYVLREVHGLRIDETAAELDLNTSQVEQALFAARNRLAEQLVFGDRLNCVTVQRLAAGPLDAPERRALKTHLRTCSDCRQTLGLRSRALSLFPSGFGFEWLRGLGPGLIGGGAPIAAKVGAVFATATIAAGVPVAVEHSGNHAHRPVLHLVDVPPAPPSLPKATAPVVDVSARSAVAPQHDSGSRGDDTHGENSHGDRHGVTTTEIESERSGSGSSGKSTSGELASGSSGSGDSGSGSGSGSGSRGSDDRSSGTSGGSSDSGSGGGGEVSHRESTTAQTSTTPFDSKSDDSKSRDESKSGSGSGSSGGDGGSGGDDGRSDGATTTTSTTTTVATITTTTTTTTTTVPVAPAPPPVTG
jgi:RNA polymerase sigma-70 factor (ECF subfamily)